MPFSFTRFVQIFTFQFVYIILIATQFSHAYHCGEAGDLRKADSYHWHAAIDMKRSDNADMRQFFNSSTTHPLTQPRLAFFVYDWS